MQADERDPQEHDIITGNVKFHPWEEAGLGLAPFRFIALAQLPPRSLQAQNPDAYNLAMNELPTYAPLGTCHYCGHALRNNFIIESSDGKKFVVGSDCVEKIDLPGSSALKLKDDVKKALIAARKEKKDKERLERRAAHEKKMKPIWEAERKAREAAAADQQERLKVEMAENAEANAWLVDVLARTNPSPFVNDLHEKLFRGESKASDLSDRCVSILRDIYGKNKEKTRFGTKKYDAAVEEFDSKIEEMEK